MSNLRLTTQEAAQILGAGYPNVLALLKAANVPCQRFGGVFLWNGKAVEGLRATLHAHGLGKVQVEKEEAT